MHGNHLLQRPCYIYTFYARRSPIRLQAGLYRSRLDLSPSTRLPGPGKYIQPFFDLEFTIPGLWGNPPNTPPLQSAHGLGLGGQGRKNPRDFGRDRSLDLLVTKPALFNVYVPKSAGTDASSTDIPLLRISPCVSFAARRLVVLGAAGCRMQPDELSGPRSRSMPHRNLEQGAIRFFIAVTRRTRFRSQRGSSALYGGVVQSRSRQAGQLYLDF
jgi:hypothetical protein